MQTGYAYHDLARIYGECILYWMLENAMENRRIADYEIQLGSGLSDVQFKIGMDWLIDQRLMERPEPERLH